MPTPAPILLLTRPRDQSEDFARDFRARFGADRPILISPILAIEPLPMSVSLDRVNFLILTSANAVPAAASLLGAMSWPVYCVGERTRQTAAEVGLEVAFTAATAADLMAAIADARPKGRALFLRGENVASDLAELLDSIGIETISAIVYRQIEKPLGVEARALLDESGTVIAPVFSPRSAALLSGQIGSCRATVHVVAISRTAAEAWRGSHERVSIAKTPDREGMLAALSAHFPE